MNYKQIIDQLDILFPTAKCELFYNKDYELLLSVMLSAQTTDKRVNMITKPLYKKYNTLEKLDSLTQKEIENLIKSIGLYKVKSSNFKKIVSYLVSTGGKVPNDRMKLQSLPGVGRKTANVVLSNLFDEPCFAVDTHVSRVSKRLGIASATDNVTKIEEKLNKFFPKKNWNRLHHQLVLFGRYICKAQKPDCSNCAFENKCKYIKKKRII